MNGWKECTLGESITFQRGFDITQLQQTKGDFPVVSSSGVNSFHNEWKVQAPGVVIGRTGTLGTVFYVDKNFWPHGTTLWVKDFQGNDPKYIYYFLFFLEFQNYDVGSSNPTLNRNHIHLLPISIPPLPEQKAIAAILSSLDEKIDLLRRQSTTLEAMAEALFLQWVVVEAKEEWRRTQLSSIAKFLNGLACQKYRPTNETDRLPVLKIRELNSGISEDTEWVTADVPQEYIIKSGDVIFSWSGSLMVKIWHGEKCVLNQHLFKVTSDIYPEWFYLSWCKYHLEEFIAISESKATTMGHIKRGDLDTAEVIVPPPCEIVKMSDAMEPLLLKQIHNNIQIRILEKLRYMILPKLMSGEVRVEY
jgi:type I restriction enzyme S subunit